MNKMNKKRKKIEQNEFGFFKKRLLELKNKFQKTTAYGTIIY